jgi:acylphosphatase
MAAKQIVLKIYGKVQGVAFRYYGRIKAVELHLSGFAQNESDGTVKIVAEGEEKKLEKFIEWCKNGPDDADVEKVEVKWHNPTNEFRDFIIIT